MAQFGVLKRAAHPEKCWRQCRCSACSQPSPVFSGPHIEQNAAPRQTRAHQSHAQPPFRQIIPSFGKHGRSAARATVSVPVNIEEVTFLWNLSFTANGLQHEKVGLMTYEGRRAIASAWRQQFVQHAQGLANGELLYCLSVLA